MPAKSVWTDDDFSVMGWHDAQLYSVDFPDEFQKIKLDIDYLFKWHWQEGRCMGWDVAPCDIVFHNVSRFRMDVNMGDNVPVCILDVRRSNERSITKLTLWDYQIELNLGMIAFSATGYVQTLRQEPIFSETQNLILRQSKLSQ